VSATRALLRNPRGGKVHRGTADNPTVECAQRGKATRYEVVAVLKPSPVEWSVGWELLAAGVRPSALCRSCFRMGFVNEYGQKWRELRQ